MSEEIQIKSVRAFTITGEPVVEFIEQIEADRMKWRTLALKAKEILSWISDEYERGERKGYDMKVTPEMNGQAKDCLAIFDEAEGKV